MKNAMLQLLKAATKEGYTLSVQGYEGAMEYPEEYDYKGTSYKKGWDACQLEGMAHVYLEKEGSKNEWAFYVGMNNPDETLSDFTCDGFIDQWWDKTEGGQK